MTCTVCGRGVCIDKIKCQLRYLDVIDQNGHSYSEWWGQCPRGCLGCRAAAEAKAIRERIAAEAVQP